MKKKLNHKRKVKRRVSTKHVTVKATRGRSRASKPIDMSSSHVLWSSTSEPGTESDIYSTVPLHRANNQENLRTYFGMQWFRHLVDLFPCKLSGHARSSSPALTTDVTDDVSTEENNDATMGRASMNLPVEAPAKKRVRKAKKRPLREEECEEERGEEQSVGGAGHQHDQPMDIDPSVDGDGQSNRNCHCNANTLSPTIRQRIKALYIKLKRKCMWGKRSVTFQLDGKNIPTRDDPSPPPGEKQVNKTESDRRDKKKKKRKVSKRARNARSAKARKAKQNRNKKASRKCHTNCCRCHLGTDGPPHKKRRKSDGNNHNNNPFVYYNPNEYYA